MSERLRTSRLIGFRDRPIEPYMVTLTLLRIVAVDPLVWSVTEQQQMITRRVRARHRLRAELGARAWLEFRSGIVFHPWSLRVDVFGPVGHPD